MYMYSEKSLYHHGIEGQRWGIRRYQYEDGTLTPAGRDRYGIGEEGSLSRNSIITPTGDNRMYATNSTKDSVSEAVRNKAIKQYESGKKAVEKGHTLRTNNLSHVVTYGLRAVVGALAGLYIGNVVLTKIDEGKIKWNSYIDPETTLTAAAGVVILGLQELLRHPIRKESNDISVYNSFNALGIDPTKLNENTNEDD